MINNDKLSELLQVTGVREDIAYTLKPRARTDTVSRLVYRSYCTLALSGQQLPLLRRSLSCELQLQQLLSLLLELQSQLCESPPQLRVLRAQLLVLEQEVARVLD